MAPMAATYSQLIHSVCGAADGEFAVSAQQIEAAVRPAANFQSLVRRTAERAPDTGARNFQSRRELELARLVNERLAPSAE